MNKDKVLKGVKIALKVVSNLGITLLCSAFAGGIASSTNAGSIKKSCMAFGGAIIGSMVADQAEKYIDAEVDNIVAQASEVMKVFNDATKDTSEEPD